MTGKKTKKNVYTHNEGNLHQKKKQGESKLDCGQLQDYKLIYNTMVLTKYSFNN